VGGKGMPPKSTKSKARQKQSSKGPEHNDSNSSTRTAKIITEKSSGLKQGLLQPIQKGKVSQHGNNNIAVGSEVLADEELLEEEKDVDDIDIDIGSWLESSASFSLSSSSSHVSSSKYQDGAINRKQGVRRNGGAIPITLQQLILNCFKENLSLSISPSPPSPFSQLPEKSDSGSDDSKKLKALVQELKTYLYNRDFDAAFAAARPDLLRVYALRWSASRALGYLGLMKGLLSLALPSFTSLDDRDDYASGDEIPHVLCIGGGAGAEIMALAGAWRNILDESYNADASTDDCDDQKQQQILQLRQQLNLEKPVHFAGDGLQVDNLLDLSLEDRENGVQSATAKATTASSARKEPGKVQRTKRLKVTAVDIADWSSVIETLSHAMWSPAVISSSAHPAPLIPSPRCPFPGESGDSQQNDKGLFSDQDRVSSSFQVCFQKADILEQTNEDLQKLLRGNNTSSSSSLLTLSIRNNPTTKISSPDRLQTVLVTLMFTLNELFSSSMAKTTQFLLNLSDLCDPGMLLLVVDSPGSYSTLTLGRRGGDNCDIKDNLETVAPKREQQQQQQKTYPMKFLLDHILLSIAKGKWRKIVSKDSIWFRRDAAALSYDVGEGVGLEDMRFQIHLYRRLEG
jgi:25S rRNA (uracil2843-N3)-methyltransferase